ncbi:unnamed protein product [Meloidogyne enterolobii]|uniref:Uncharacterized protein n=1 Tax=Meloidogyne enterolobii TaxID=390850 RepID=A0ACB0YZD3_MELEN
MIESLIAEADKLDLNILSIGLSCHRNSFVTLNRFLFFKFYFSITILHIRNL